MICRSDKAERVLSENGYARLLAMLSGFSDAPFIGDDARQGYLEAWSRPGALTAMLNWYRASPIYVPVSGEKVETDKALVLDPARLPITMPHLLIHGVEDRALRPAAFEGVGAFAPDFEVFRVKGAGHWILHEKPDLVAQKIMEWISS